MIPQQSTSPTPGPSKTSGSPLPASGSKSTASGTGPAGRPPGLSDKDWTKSVKEMKKKEAKALNVKKKPSKKAAKKTLTKPVIEATENSLDFSQFTFDGTSTDDENFEDSKEELSDTEDLEEMLLPDALTPSFKSTFGKKFALSYERSTSTPDLRIKQTETATTNPKTSARKRVLSSPGAQFSQKKTKPSLIPKKKGKED